MNLFRTAAVLAFGLVLAGCATSSSESLAERTNIHLSAVTAQAASGVTLDQAALDRMVGKVKSQMAVTTPGMLTTAPSSDALALKITITRYDAGSSTAMALTGGLAGQMYIDAELTLVDSAGRPMGSYQVSKHYALGGLYAVNTSIEDVEDGFAKSIAAVVR